MKAELLSFCRKEHLFDPGETVICAVSGGADSIALLHCLHSLQQELEITVRAAHFNHRLRGEASQEDEAFVRSFCNNHRIPLHLGAMDVVAYAQKRHLGIEEAARQCRYRFFEGLEGKVATAHHADDNLETVLLHLLRGSGLRGLCGIPPKRAQFVRPMLSISKEQILQYLQDQDLAWREDASNAELFCSRNRLRHEVIPLLRQENPRLVQRVSKQSALLRQEDALLDELAHACLRQEADGSYALAPLRSASDALQKRALRLLLRGQLPQDVSLSHIEALQALLHNENPSARLALPGGLQAQRRYDALVLCKGEPSALPETALNIPGITRLPSVGLKISCRIEKNFEKFTNSPFHFAVKYDMIAPNKLTVRSRRTGDGFLTRGGHRVSLKKLLIDRKIPRSERDRLPVFTDGSTVFAVGGLGVRQGFAPAQGETALIIFIEKEEM